MEVSHRRFYRYGSESGDNDESIYSSASSSPIAGRGRLLHSLSHEVGEYLGPDGGVWDVGDVEPHDF